MRLAAFSLMIALVSATVSAPTLLAQQYVSAPPPLAPDLVAPHKSPATAPKRSISNAPAFKTETPQLAPLAQPAAAGSSASLPGASSNATGGINPRAGASGAAASSTGVANQGSPAAGGASSDFAVQLSWIQKNDPTYGALSAIDQPNWKSLPVEVFVSSRDGYTDQNGRHPSLPLNQQAAIVNEYHCTHILSKTFERPQRAATALVYCFRSPAEAFGAYSTMRKGASTVVVRGDASSEEQDSISIWQGNHFIVLTATAQDDDTSKELISAVADKLSGNGYERARRPQLVESLPVIDRMPGSERLFFGPLAARRYLSFPYFQSLMLDKSAGAAMAEYQFLPPYAERMKLLSIDYEDPDFAGSTFHAFIDALAMSNKARLVQPQMQLCKLKDSYILTVLSGRRVTIITGAKHKESPMMLSTHLYF